MSARLNHFKWYYYIILKTKKKQWNPWSVKSVWLKRLTFWWICSLTFLRKAWWVHFYMWQTKKRSGVRTCPSETEHWPVVWMGAKITWWEVQRMSAETNQIILSVLCDFSFLSFSLSVSGSCDRVLGIQTGQLDSNLHVLCASFTGSYGH